MFITSNFRPAWWLRNRHLQTIAPKYLRKSLQIESHDQRLNLPDGDFLTLSWTELPHTNNKPIVIILHGLEGSKDSHYAKGMMLAIKQQGWLGVLMHFRGCCGQVNKKAQSYHSGDTRDISYVSHWLKDNFPNRLFAAVGFSLGGNVLSKYLAEAHHYPFRAAAIICAPLHLASCSARINQGASKIYQKYLVDMLKASTLTKIANGVIEPEKQQQVQSIRTMYEFDQTITAPINGFNSAEDYYQQASGLNTLNLISTNTLILHAKDDPFLCHQAVTNTPSLPTNIAFEVAPSGGHVGFISGNNPFKPVYWLEQRIPQFFKAFV